MTAGMVTQNDIESMADESTAELPQAPSQGAVQWLLPLTKGVGETHPRATRSVPHRFAGSGRPLRSASEWETKPRRAVKEAPPGFPPTPGLTWRRCAWRTWQPSSCRRLCLAGIETLSPASTTAAQGAVPADRPGGKENMALRRWLADGRPNNDGTIGHFVPYAAHEFSCHARRRSRVACGSTWHNSTPRRTRTRFELRFTAPDPLEIGDSHPPGGPST
jgi:hypothetical protein